MKRRTALKSLMMATGSLVTLPAWATGWTPETVGQTTFASRAEETMRKRLAGIEARAQSAPSLNVIVEGILVPMRVVIEIMML